MSRAIGRLLLGVMLAAGAAVALAALFGLVAGGDFGDRFRVGLWAAGCLLLLLSVTGSSPGMQRAQDQEGRTMLGRMMRATTSP